MNWKRSEFTKDFRGNLRAMAKKNTPLKLEAAIEGWAVQLWPDPYSEMNTEALYIVNLMGNEILLVRRALEEKNSLGEEDHKQKISQIRNEALVARDDLIRIEKSFEEAVNGIRRIANWRECERKSSAKLHDEASLFVDDDLWSDLEEYADNLLKRIKRSRKGKD